MLTCFLCNNAPPKLAISLGDSLQIYVKPDDMEKIKWLFLSAAVQLDAD